MLRHKIPFLPDTYYHFYNRGNKRQAIFFEAANYLYFLRGISKYVYPAAEVIAYCLMPMHYHLLVRVSPPQTFIFSKTIRSQSLEFIIPDGANL